MPNPAASPAVSSTVGLKNMVIAPLTVDTEETLTYGDLQLVAGAIEASITPQSADPDVQYFDDQEGDVLYPDPELSFKTKLADLPLIIQEMIFANKIDSNGVLIRSSTDKPPYFAVGFKSEKANHKFRYIWLYKVRAKPVTENYATKEGKLSEPEYRRSRFGAGEHDDGRVDRQILLEYCHAHPKRIDQRRAVCGDEGVLRGGKFRAGAV